MQLKLAEYKDGKFERFGELLSAKRAEYGQFDSDQRGKIFFELGKDFISVTEVWQSGAIANRFINKKDEKDPLNRFNGLFDGRTYGEGRFVLIESSRKGESKELDDIWHHSQQPDDPNYCNIVEIWNLDSDFGLSMKLGNLHENPELWEKVK